MIACVYIPYFARRIFPSPRPVIVVRHFKRRAKVIACSPEVEKLGVLRGLALSRARALCPQANFVSADDPALGTAQERLLNTLWLYTNRVEIDADAYPHHLVAYLDLGILRPDDALQLADDAIEAVTNVFGARPAVGLARGKLTAYIAASNGGVRLVTPAEDAAYIASSPVEMLPLIKDEARLLHLLGLYTLGSLAALPRGSVMAALGKHGALLHGLAHGLDGRPVKPASMPQAESVGFQFAPLHEVEHLDYHLQRAIASLTSKLERRGSAAHRVTLTLCLEDGKSLTETLRLLDPVGGAAGLKEVFGKLYARMRIKGEIVGLEVCATHLVVSMPVQLELFGAKPTSKGVIDLTRVLAARYGTDDLFTIAVGQTRSLLLERRYVRQHILLENDGT